MNQQTDRKLYMALIIASVILTMLCFCINPETPWFTIGTGISGGGFASALIAWLIEDANAKKAAAKAKRNRDMLFQKIFSSFNYGMILLIYSAEKHLKDDVPRTWFQWVDSAHQITKDDPAYSHDFDLSLRAFFTDISEELSSIKGQSAVLLDYGVLSVEDIDALSRIQSICRLTIIECDVEQNEKTFTEQIYHRCRIIHDIIKSVPALRFFNETPIDPTQFHISEHISD